MNISENARSTASAVSAIFGVDADEETLRKASQLIERSIINAILNESERYNHVILNCCSADLDLAHKLNEEIRASNKALMANLESMR